MRKILLFVSMVLGLWLLPYSATVARAESTRRPRLSRPQIIRLGRLLHMLYKPSEIAKLLEISVDTIYRNYLPAGCPHERDDSGNIWINGIAFKGWAEELLSENRRRKKENPMAPNEGWCFKCNQRVIMVNVQPARVNRYLELLMGTCPKCGTRVNRARKAGAGNDQPR